MFSNENRTGEKNNIAWRQVAMTKDQWEGIVALKKQFFSDNSVDLQNSPYLNRIIAESWIRSREAGVDPHKNTVTHFVSPHQYEEIRNKNKMIIAVTKPLFDVFVNLIKSSNYAMFLIDRQGTCLLYENSFQHLKDTSNLKDLILTLSSNESTTGTSSHALSMQHERPVQLVGPEHYLVGLEDMIASSAPIFDEKNNVIACLTLLSRVITDSPWEKGYQVLSAHTLGLITAIANAIESQLMLQKSNRQLEDYNIQLLSANNELTNANRKILTAHDLLDTTLSLLDEGIVTLNYQGNILEINQAAMKMLLITDQRSEILNIATFLSEDSLILKYITEGKNFSHKEEVFHIGNTIQTFIVSMKLVFEGDNNKPELAVIRFQNASIYNLHATKRVGTKASFRFKNMIGESSVFKETVFLAEKFAKSSENVLLIGESGTGKELFAQSIHNAYRPEGPFIALNCAAIPRTLIESELFGYESGSFTGADRSGRPGKIELADKGTLFLDEIGDMPLDIQAVLLRVLEEKKVMRIGGRKEKEVDFRVIAATNKDLRQMVQDKTFREDIYFRLSVLNIKVPPLRARTGDIERLCQHFISSYCLRIGRERMQLDENAFNMLTSYSWPGNIRQLENAIVYSINVSEGSIIEARHLPEDIIGSTDLTKLTKKKTLPPLEVNGAPNSAYYPSTLRELERDAIVNALEKNDGSITQAASLLDISKSTLYRRIKEFKLNIKIKN